jgi:hypothetical protein
MRPTRSGEYERAETLLAEREAKNASASVQHGADLDITIVSIPRRDAALRLRLKTFSGTCGLSIRTSELDEVIAALERARDRLIEFERDRSR